MKKLNVLMCGLLLGGLVFTGCSDDDDKGGNAEGTEAAVVAHEYGEWTYFNFADGATKTLPLVVKVVGQGGSASGFFCQLAIVAKNGYIGIQTSGDMTVSGNGTIYVMFDIFDYYGDW